MHGEVLMFLQLRAMYMAAMLHWNFNMLQNGKLAVTVIMMISGTVKTVFVLKYMKDVMATLIVQMVLMNWIAVS